MAREGTLIFFLGVAFFITSVLFYLDWRNTASMFCMMGDCPHSYSVPLSVVAGLLISSVAMIAGLYLRGGVKVKYVADEVELSEDERRVVELIKKNGGLMFQSAIVEETGFSKSKVSRILDRLEAMGVVEKRRRGMTNVVILKQV